MNSALENANTGLHVITMYYCLAVGVAIWCSITDVTHRRIPNLAVLLLSVMAVVVSFISGTWISWSVFLLSIIVGVLLYLFRCFGAGDIKFFWACMLMVPEQLEMLLVSTALFGGLLALVYLAKHKFHPKEVGTLPYGVAISSGLVLCLCEVMF